MSHSVPLSHLPNCGSFGLRVEGSQIFGFPPRKGLVTHHHSDRIGFRRSYFGTALSSLPHFSIMGEKRTSIISVPSFTIRNCRYCSSGNNSHLWSSCMTAVFWIGFCYIKNFTHNYSPNGESIYTSVKLGSCGAMGARLVEG